MIKRFFITTPIYYVNDKPHIGHTYTTLVADVLTRFFRLQGNEAFFLTGTDEHGIKIAESAEKLGKTPKEFCDENSGLFKKTWENLNIKYDYFIRTTDKNHEEIVKKFIEVLNKKGVIYEKEYEGLYCNECEKFLTEKDLENGLCPDHKTKPKKISEKNYFFKLKKYLADIDNLINEGKIKISPDFAKKEVLGLLKQNLEDFSISRQKQKVGWGINLPFDNQQVVYVWVDALLNYVSAIGYGYENEKFDKWWNNAEIIHLLAKDILKFHTIYWPALLLSAGIKVPDKEFIHGFFTVNGQKMSKTIGNVIDSNNMVDNFGVDATRYLLLSQFPFGQDGDVQESRFVEKYNADLANGLGNLVARVLTLARKYEVNIDAQIISDIVLSIIKKTRNNYNKMMEDLKLFDALKEIWGLISFCDKYMNENKPWKIDQKDFSVENSKLVIVDLLFCINEISNMITPFLPQTSEKIKEQLQGGELKNLFQRK
jgi:methionyl-tRNA synthetase